MTTKTITSFQHARKLHTEAMQVLNEQRHPDYRPQLRASVDPDGLWSDKARAERYAAKVAELAAGNRARAEAFLEQHARAVERLRTRHADATQERESATDPHRVAMYRDEYRSTIGRDTDADSRAAAVERETAAALEAGDVNRVRALRIEGPELMAGANRSPAFLDRAWDGLLPEDVRNAPAELAELNSMRSTLQERSLEIEGLFDETARNGTHVSGDHLGQPTAVAALFQNTAD